MIPTYCDITICYNPAEIAYQDLLNQLKQIDATQLRQQPAVVNLLHIPVLYGGETETDLDIVARHNHLAPDEVIRLHTTPRYLVYMLGFTPGFVYLGGLNEKIATPRKQVPRKVIKAGAVGIAGHQTGIYPIESPGGWQIIGQTPLKMFDIHRKPEVLIESGDYIQFDAIDEIEFQRITQCIEEKNYQPVIEQIKNPNE